MLKQKSTKEVSVLLDLVYVYKVKIFPILKGGDANELLNSRTRNKAP